ncbi:adrenocorticotropic hormone receptor-like [Rhopilema esculentum]|uniref:adrenocorticotropic hormone receptor-like n=1 Tax=Rhopilema esculentum TaxID=499914 RepID=UPI0031D5913F|eukprot:gene16028-7373_t
MEYSCLPESTGNFSLILICLGIPFHVLIAKILAKDLELTLPRHKILFCLSLSDGLQISLVALFYPFIRAFHLTTSSNTCIVLRKILLFSSVVTVVVSSLSLVALSIERYIACVHSFRLYEVLTNRRICAAITIFWSLGTVLGIYAIFSDDISNKETIVGETRSFQIIASTVITLTTIIITVVQVSLFRLSRKKMSQVSPSSAFGSEAEYSDLRKKQVKVAVIAGIVVLAYIVCMVPMSSVFILEKCKVLTVSKSVRASVIMFGMTNTLFDPFVYGIGILDIRRAIKRHIMGVVDYFYNCNLL